MIWATRRGCHVDRAACVWLIRRCVDPEAEFVFVDDPDELPSGATPFDMRGAELSHGDWSFETFVKRYELEAASSKGGRHPFGVAGARARVREARCGMATWGPGRPAPAIVAA